MSNPATCTAYWRTRDDQLVPAVCGEPAPYEVADTFFCDHHYRRALQWAETVVRCRDSMVYYVQREDGLIKIGMSRDCPVRLETIARQHGPLDLLAVHGGARQEEAAVHRAFKALRVEGEWFRPELPLLEHIVKVRKKRGNLEREEMPPMLSRITLGKMIARAQRESVAVTVAVR